MSTHCRVKMHPFPLIEGFILLTASSASNPEPTVSATTVENKSNNDVITKPLSSSDSASWPNLSTPTLTQLTFYDDRLGHHDEDITMSKMLLFCPLTKGMSKRCKWQMNSSKNEQHHRHSMHTTKGNCGKVPRLQGHPIPSPRLNCMATITHRQVLYLASPNLLSHMLFRRSHFKYISHCGNKNKNCWHQ